MGKIANIKPRRGMGKILRKIWYEVTMIMIIIRPDFFAKFSQAK